MQKLKTAGEMLREERLKQEKSLVEMAEVTKIRVEVLAGIEKGDFSKVTSFTTARGLIGNYAKALKVEPEKVLAVFRRDFVVGPKGDVLLRGLAYPLDQPGVVWTPKLTIIIVVASVVAIFAGYLGYQYWRTSSVPYLAVERPVVGETFTGNEVEVEGKTRPDTQVTVNSRVVVVDNEGNFKIELLLPEGLNEIVVTAISRTGRTNVVRRQVTVE